MCGKGMILFYLYMCSQLLLSYHISLYVYIHMHVPDYNLARKGRDNHDLYL